MRIGEVAQLAGVASSRIRYYERIGLLRAPDRVSGQRRYDDRVLRRLAVIGIAQRAGMKLDEIRTLIEHGDAPLGDVLRDLSDAKLPAIDALIDRAQRVRRWLVAAQNCQCPTIEACALFDEAPATQPPAARAAPACPTARAGRAAPQPRRARARN